MSAKFITLEGGEGAGKSTSLAFIRDYLGHQGQEALFTREPGGTRLGEKLRELVLTQGTAIEAEAELLLMCAARVQHVRTVIQPALQSGQWVVSDRFMDASYAYQGGGRQVDNRRIDYLHDWLLAGTQPDLTLFLDVPIELGLARAGRRSTADRFESEQRDFFVSVQSVYRQRAADEPERIQCIDASRPLVEVQADIQQQLQILCESCR